MLVMRMYALYEKSKKVLFFYIILALLIIGIGVVRVSSSISPLLLISLCRSGLSLLERKIRGATR